MPTPHDHADPSGPLVTERLDLAFALARRLHAADVRKATATPYLAHLLSVAGLVLEHGGDEDLAIAALLHDTAEDHGGWPVIDQVRTAFGDRVADVVLACSDSLVEDATAKAPWWERKTAYLDRLPTEPYDVLLVSAADKLHNLRSMVADHRRQGEALWDRFNPEAGRAGQLWYQHELLHRLDGVAGAVGPLRDLVDDLARTLDRLEALVLASPEVELTAEALAHEWRAAPARAGVVAA